MIEVELRSFISEGKFNELVEFMSKNALPVKDTGQETWYFSGDADLRIQRSDTRAKLWLKGGKIHDDAREEVEIILHPSNFENMAKILSVLGFEVEIKWFRHRKEFDWGGTKVCLDHTKGYGWIVELETLVGAEEHRDAAVENLKGKMKELGVTITPREEFERAFSNYKQNWKTLTA